MKRLVLSATALALTAGLVACGQQQVAQTENTTTPVTDVAAANAAPAETGSTSNRGALNTSADAKMAKGAGTVMAVDATAGTITIDHGPIPEVNWPAMTMGFKTAPQVAGQVKVGDKVTFDLKLEGGSGEVTAIAKQ